MSSKARQKGYRTVSYGREWFESLGYIGANVERNSMFSKERDCFGLWDYIFLKGDSLIFVQFKTNMVLGKTPPGQPAKLRKWTEPYIKFGVEHGSEHVSFIIFNKIDNLGHEILECSSTPSIGIVYKGKSSCKRKY